MQVMCPQVYFSKHLSSDFCMTSKYQGNYANMYYSETNLECSGEQIFFYMMVFFCHCDKHLGETVKSGEIHLTFWFRALNPWPFGLELWP